MKTQISMGYATRWITVLALWIFAPTPGATAPDEPDRWLAGQGTISRLEAILGSSKVSPEVKRVALEAMRNFDIEVADVSASSRIVSIIEKLHAWKMLDPESEHIIGALKLIGEYAEDFDTANGDGAFGAQVLERFQPDLVQSLKKETPRVNQALLDVLDFGVSNRAAQERVEEIRRDTESKLGPSKPEHPVNWNQLYAKCLKALGAVGADVEAFDTLKAVLEDLPKDEEILVRESALEGLRILVGRSRRSADREDLSAAIEDQRRARRQELVTLVSSVPTNQPGRQPRDLSEKLFQDFRLYLALDPDRQSLLEFFRSIDFAPGRADFYDPILAAGIRFLAEGGGLPEKEMIQRLMPASSAGESSAFPEAQRALLESIAEVAIDSETLQELLGGADYWRRWVEFLKPDYREDLQDAAVRALRSRRPEGKKVGDAFLEIVLEREAQSGAIIGFADEFDDDFSQEVILRTIGSATYSNDWSGDLNTWLETVLVGGGAKEVRAAAACALGERGLIDILDKEVVSKHAEISDRAGGALVQTAIEFLSRSSDPEGIYEGSVRSVLRDGKPFYKQSALIGLRRMIIRQPESSERDETVRELVNHLGILGSAYADPSSVLMSLPDGAYSKGLALEVTDRAMAKADQPELLMLARFVSKGYAPIEEFLDRWTDDESKAGLLQRPEKIEHSNLQPLVAMAESQMPGQELAALRAAIHPDYFEPWSHPVFNLRNLSLLLIAVAIAVAVTWRFRRIALRNVHRPLALVVQAPSKPLLDELVDETANVQKYARASKCCDSQLVQPKRLKDVFEWVEDEHYRNRIVIFHYAGHANGAGIKLQGEGDESGEMVLIGGLAGALMDRQRDSLQLVFLNGCETEDQAKELLSAGVPVVISTTRPIDDRVAMQVASHFYQRLSDGDTIEMAFRSAMNVDKSTLQPSVRGARPERLDDQSEREAWIIESNESSNLGWTFADGRDRLLELAEKNRAETHG